MGSTRPSAPVTVAPERFQQLVQNLDCHNNCLYSRAVTTVRRRVRLAVWRSPSDQPPWARPLLLVTAAASALLYSWRAGTTLELYYAAAVRTMSASWHDFIFGAFDPVGTVSLDKLPGAFWVQALSVRVFGLHTWSIVLPQVVEGVLSVLVLFRVVRRLCGAPAGLLAAVVLALSPAVVALDRGNIADSLMVLLLLLAADATVDVVQSGRWRSAVLAGLWVGLAFQAKMVEAWLVLPALVLVVVLAAPGTVRRRLVTVLALVAVTVVVSLSWMTAVTLTPAHSRPYVDGSADNSVFHQVFVYNGVGRVDQESPNQLLTQSIGLDIPTPPPASWHRLLTGPLGRDTGWLLPAAVVALVAMLGTRRRPRTDPWRVHAVLWGAWLVVLAGTFSVSSSANPYYTAALAPPVAALIAAGSVLAWRSRPLTSVRITVMATVVGSVAYAVWLLPSSGTGLPGWLAPVLVVVGAVAVVGVAATWGRVPTRVVEVGLVASAVALLAVPAAAAVSITATRLGPFDTPFQPVAVTTGTRAFFGVTSATSALIPTLEAARHGAPFLMATETSALAAPFIFVTGQEVLPIGGYTGTIPSPTLARIRSLVRSGSFHLVLQSPSATDHRFVWIAHHCLHLPQPTGTSVPVRDRFAISYCLPSS